MAVAVPADFNFDSNCSSPYITAPSSPQRFGNFSSSTSTNFPQDHCFDDSDDYSDQFQFTFSGQLDRDSLSAEELFDGGKIRPLKPHPPPESGSSAAERQERGRERTIPSSSASKSSNYIHKGSRSLSPLRVSDLILDPEEDDSGDPKTVQHTATTSRSSYASSFLSAISFSSKGYKKWKLKDLLLFRSASEGRVIGKDRLTKYAVLSKRSEAAEDVKNSSFRSTEIGGAGSCSRRRGRVSAHELHYTANRAVAEEMKRKTFLPYKHGLLGCLGFNQDLSRSIGSLTRG